ncbi:hypothetical protein NDU88_003618 [Pleurodeles waltl]|uniref:Uncharacterized protein n=1 Tax=Pleurodeles waltl TaxID=8319 RepID=A0AAV7UYZ8_PLEWA|nr:hypothetical protein NDU88_003618 [Pleurodeles waltl]
MTEQENPILGAMPRPSLSSSLVAELDLPLTGEEAGEAISSFQSRKNSGPDGYPVEYYKRLQSHLESPLVNTYDEALRCGSFTPGLDYTIIKPKDDLPRDPCSSYQPISLIKADIKIFAEVLAARQFLNGAPGQQHEWVPSPLRCVKQHGRQNPTRYCGSGAAWVWGLLCGSEVGVPWSQRSSSQRAQQPVGALVGRGRRNEQDRGSVPPLYPE